MNGTRGLYEELITAALADEIERLDRRFETKHDELGAAEAGDRIALHLGRTVRRAIADITEKKRVEDGIALAREIIECIERRLPDAECLGDMPTEGGRVLRAIAGRLPNGDTETIVSPRSWRISTPDPRAGVTFAPRPPRRFSLRDPRRPSCDEHAAACSM